MKARGSMGCSALRLGAGGLCAFFMFAGARAAWAQMYDPPPPPYDYPVPMAPIPRVPHPVYGPDEYYPPEPEPEPEQMFHERRRGAVTEPQIDDLDGPRPHHRALATPSPKRKEAVGSRRALAPRPALKAPARSPGPVPAPLSTVVRTTPPAQEPASRQERVKSAASAAAQAPAPPIATKTGADPAPVRERRDVAPPPMNATEGKSNIDR